jgi:hypothetical protein
VLDELAVLLDLLLEPQPVRTAAAITAAATRLAVDAHARRGDLEVDDLMIGLGLADMKGGSTGVTAPPCHQLVNAGWRHRCAGPTSPIEIFERPGSSECGWRRRSSVGVGLRARAMRPISLLLAWILARGRRRPASRPQADPSAWPTSSPAG